MIDAYEIGIQLALQDGVSAGLDVIGRELAAVDQAIAATSAGLAQLARAAETAIGAAGMAAVSRPTSRAKPEDIVGTEGLQARPRDGKPETGDVDSRNADALNSSAPTASPPVAPSQPREMTAFTAVARQSDSPLAAVVQDREVRESAAPVERPAEAASPVIEQRPTAPDIVAAMLPMFPSPPAAPTSRTPLRASDRSTFPVKQADPVRPTVRTVAASNIASAPLSVAARPTDPMTASIARAMVVRQSTSDRGGAPASAGRDEQGAMRQEPVGVSIAPRSGSEHSAVAPRASSLLGRAVAPQPQPRESNEGAGGTVVLDGRLVGYWLSEQMARDAARPPGGPSFFDPRQTPAWNVSGAV